MLRFSVSRLTTASGCMLWVLGALLGTQSPLRAQNISSVPTGCGNRSRGSLHRAFRS
jgi:hypothetical protein